MHSSARLDGLVWLLHRNRLGAQRTGAGFVWFSRKLDLSRFRWAPGNARYASAGTARTCVPAKPSGAVANGNGSGPAKKTKARARSAPRGGLAESPAVTWPPTSTQKGNAWPN